jgi:NitT/TauT family transport system substrate-binding protein
MRSLVKLFGSEVLALAALAVVLAPAWVSAAPKTDFKIAWSVYAGWMPWGYAADSGLMKKWADKYGIKVTIAQVNDYVESINRYAAGGFDGCAMTNLDALTIAATRGVDSTALIAGDYSNGTDGIVLKKGANVAALKGRKVHLVELSVSHYLLARALDSVKLSEKDITVVNTSDADIVSAYSSNADVTAVVTWNPQLAAVKRVPSSNLVFHSGYVAGEILDLMVVNTQTLKDNPALGKALVGVWYELLALMASDTAAGISSLESMARASGTDLAGYRSQLGTTQMFSKPAEAATFNESAQVPKTMELVRSFSFSHGLLGKNANTKDVVGIAFPGGQVLGDPKNVKLRFDSSYMRMAADGKL